MRAACLECLLVLLMALRARRVTSSSCPSSAATAMDRSRPSNEWRRLNVAITRAKRTLLMFGDASAIGAGDLGEAAADLDEGTRQRSGASIRTIVAAVLGQYWHLSLARKS